MVVHKLGYTARIEIDYSAVENTDGMEEYMKRHGWKTIGLGVNARLVQDEYNSRSYSAFTKDFADVSTMQMEIKDIDDAFNR